MRLFGEFDGVLHAVERATNAAIHVEGDELVIAGARDATDEVLEKLASLNQDYERRFGFVFLICATGKSASEMLTALQERIGHAKPQELEIAAREQAKKLLK